MYTWVGNKVVYSHILRAEIKSRPIGILYIHTKFLIITVCAFVSDLRPFRLFASAGKMTDNLLHISLDTYTHVDRRQH